MFRKISAMFCAGALLALAGCAGVNKVSAGLGLGVEFTDVYAEASTFEERVWLTAGLYEATVEVVTAQCSGITSDSAIFPACAAAADTADRISPALQATLRSLAVYLEAKAAVDAHLAEHGTAPEELVNAASIALAGVALEFAPIRADIERFVSGPGN